MRVQPRVNEGMRSGRDTPGRVVPEGDRSDPGLYSRISALLRGKNIIVDRGEKTPYDVVFASRYAHHMVQVTAPEDIVDGKTGRKTRGRPIVVIFNNSLYSVPKHKYRDPEQAQQIVDWLRGHPNYKNDFWEQKDMANEATIRKAVHVIESVSSDKAIRETVLEYLTKNDFVDDETRITGAAEFGSTVVGEGGGEGGDEEIPEDAEDETGDGEGDEDDTEDEQPPPVKSKPARAPKGKPGRKKK